ncbi:MAG: EAL domain-containing protein [Candidatus Competibacteraceae bacterium]|nr:EAL domain-containing protein [Candidatus Competibacteraceae bacterium]
MAALMLPDLKFQLDSAATPDHPPSEGQAQADIALENVLPTLTQILDLNPAATFILQAIPGSTDHAFQPLYLNPQFEHMTGYTAADWRQPGFWAAHVHPEDRPVALANQYRLQHQGQIEHEYRFCHHDGHYLWVNDRLVAQYDAKGAISLLMGVWWDITGRKETEARLRLAASVFAEAHEGILITDIDANVVDVNAGFSMMTGYSREEILGRNPRFLRSGRQPPEFYVAMWQTLLDTGGWRGEVWNRRKDGQAIIVLLNISAVKANDGMVTHYVGVLSDLTALRQSEQRLEHIAYYDPLTRLPNRNLFTDRMYQALAQADRQNTLLAVCYLDLDGFKPVNDTLSHAAGDKLLIAVAERLNRGVRGDDTVARMGGDEFAVLLGGLSSVEECENALTRLLRSLSRLHVFGDRSFEITASIGVTLYPNDGGDTDALLRHADQAMYLAKQAGGNRYLMFDAEHDRRAHVHRAQLSRIDTALTTGEFRLYYQPKVDLREGRVIGAEALVRWQHPERGLLPPSQFLPAIEGHPLLAKLDCWVLAEALNQMDRWQTQEGLPLTLSVNISATTLQQPDFPDRLAVRLAAHPQIAPAQLELEVLETAALNDLNHTAQVLEQCARLGVSFALDDFGTGYSSLAYLRRLPVRTVKIDQSFVRDMLTDAEDMAIVEGVISLAQAFQREVVAEGVETVLHGAVLLKMGCACVQGYGIARPMPPDALPDWVQNFDPHPFQALSQSLPWLREDLPLLTVISDHQNWCEQIVAQLRGERCPTLPTPNHHRCHFDHWCSGAGQRRYGNLAVFQAVERLHHQTHVLAQELLDLHRANSAAALARLPELHAARDELIAQLQRLQQELQISHLSE